MTPTTKFRMASMETIIASGALQKNIFALCETMTSIEIVIPTASTFSVPTILCTTEFLNSAVGMSDFLYFSLRNGILHDLFDVFVSNNLSLHAMFLLERTNATKTSFPGAFAITLKDVQVMATNFLHQRVQFQGIPFGICF